MTPELKEDPAAWHRKFASAANNRAWDLSTRPRTAEEDMELLSAAHAAAWHWQQVGTELNRMRATMLLAEAHALAGSSVHALMHAERMRNYFLAQGAPDWEMAFVHTIHAHAASVAGRTADHRASHALATAAIAAIADDEDRRVVMATFGHVPVP